MDCCSNLPIDIVNSILLELPVKSLLRFKTTCKSWCCNIDDPYFIELHLRKCEKKLIFYKFKGKTSNPIEVRSTEASISADSKVVLIDHLYIPEGYVYIRSLQVISCSGVVFIYMRLRNPVFLREYKQKYIQMILWNPVIRKYRQIPEPDYLLQNGIWSARPLYCFAYDFVAEDYKILCVIQVTTNTGRPRYVVEIYSVKNQLWRRVRDIFPVPVPTDFSLYIDNGPVSLNGVIHIIARHMISFHLADEKFIVTLVPSKCGRCLKLHVLDDRVCVMAILDDGISIWSLEKDGKTWNNISKFPSLGSVIGFPSWYSGEVICVKENGNILWRKDDGRFIEYNLRKNEYTEFEVKKIPLGVEIGPLYVESLASLKIPWD